MMVPDDLKQGKSLRNILRIYGLSLPGYYYKPRESHVERLDLLHQRGDQGHCIRKTNILIQ